MILLRDSYLQYRPYDDFFIRALMEISNFIANLRDRIAMTEFEFVLKYFQYAWLKYSSHYDVFLVA